MNLVRILFYFGLGFLFSSAALGGPKTLIDYKGGKASAGIASSWKSLGAGKYEFTLGSHKVGGQAVTPAMVKSSVEKKLKKKGVSVTPQGANKVVVSYTGDEANFLKDISRARIRGGGNALAVESTVAGGGIRAKTAVREPSGNEVKGKIMAVNGDKVKILVLNTGKSGLAAKAKKGQLIEVSGKGSFAAQKGSEVFFKPKSANPWVASGFSAK